MSDMISHQHIYNWNTPLKIIFAKHIASRKRLWRIK